MNFMMKSVSLLVSVAALAIPGLATAGEATPIALISSAAHAEYVGMVSRGFDMIRAGKPGKAVKLFDSVISANEQGLTGDARPRLCLSEKAAGHAAPGNAVMVSGAVCDAHFGKGFALVDLGRGDLAEAELRRATELAPDNAHYANEYAELFKSRRQFQESYDLFARAWSVVDKDTKGPDAGIAARALRGMGFNLIELGRLDEAKTMFSQSLAYDAGNAAAKTELDFIAQRQAIGS
ncbi:diguanylate cyclase [Novosphingobium clariflavum]|uniref:Diguanylate cyclase n=1 Tax=Novosphingobium clariflavum TaxID=2029884 RepID=A0ABV6SCF5_9SPHN|nr:diguanylate cyclase [Novosphingobium clariflavum]